MTRPANLACFVLLMFEFGPEFHRHPKIESILNDATLAPEARLQKVVDDTPSAVWKEVTAQLHRQTWFSREETGK